MLVDAVDLEAEGRGEVLLVADHHVDVLGELAVDLAGALLPADRAPQAWPVVEVVGDRRAVRLGRCHDGLRGRGALLAERREDPAGVQPAHPELAEQPVQVEVVGAQLRDGGVAAVGDALGAAHAEAALGEVQAVARATAHTVRRGPADPGRVHPTGQDQPFDQVADLVVDERGDHGGGQAEHPRQAAHHVVLAAALPCGEAPCGADAEVTRVEPEHDLAECHRLVAAVGGGPQRQGRHLRPPPGTGPPPRPPPR